MTSKRRSRGTTCSQRVRRNASETLKAMSMIAISNGREKGRREREKRIIVTSKGRSRGTIRSQRFRRNASEILKAMSMIASNKREKGERE